VLFSRYVYGVVNRVRASAIQMRCTYPPCNLSFTPFPHFAQVNTEGAELLYQLAVDKVREVSADPAKTLLFDVCCGTGTIGLTMMKEGVVGAVVGGA